VNLRKKDEHHYFRNNFEFGLLGEDVFYASMMAKNGRGGFSAFVFEAYYGSQKKGGCFEFREKK
jgi:hypothetical protein